MAVQLNCEELSGCPDYLTWMLKKVLQNSSLRDDFGKGEVKNPQRSDKIGSQRGSGKGISGFSGNGELSGQGTQVNGDISARQGNAIEAVARVMFEVDFICPAEGISDGRGTAETIKDDEIRATDAMELRRRYADEVGISAGKSERDTDRIWKSIHGKCSVLELILSLCFRLDEMLNEDEPEQMVGEFFGIFLRNLGLENAVQTKEDRLEVLSKISRFMERKYKADGSGGGLFPLREWSVETGKDQRKVSIWYQMNTWLNEHLDEEEHFFE